MTSQVADRPDTVVRMGKGKKRPGGSHSTPRVAVSFPEPWHAVARRLAAVKQQPVLYTLIALLQAEAEKQGMETPPPPWEGDDKPD